MNKFDLLADRSSFLPQDWISSINAARFCSPFVKEVMTRGQAWYDGSICRPLDKKEQE